MKRRGGGTGKRGRPRKNPLPVEGHLQSPSVSGPTLTASGEPPKKRGRKPKPKNLDNFEEPIEKKIDRRRKNPYDENVFTPEGLHISVSQVKAIGDLVVCKSCGEKVEVGIRPTTKGMISEFTVKCTVCGDSRSTNTPNLIRERKRKYERRDSILQKTENLNYAHVAAFLDNGLGYSGLRHYCNYYHARCLNEATFIVYARQVIQDVVNECEESLHANAQIIRKVFQSHLESDDIIDLTVAFTTTYHQWGSDFCLVAGAVIELQTGLVLDYDVANMYCHVCKINAKKIITMSPDEMTDWFNKHQDTCEIREWCDKLDDHDTEEGIREIEPKYLEYFIAKKIWARSVEKFGFRYTTLIHESDEKIHAELLKASPYGDIPIFIDNFTNCFSRRKSEHARTSFQAKLKAKCPRERVQTKDRIMYVYAMSIPEYNRFAIGSNIKLRELVRSMEDERLDDVDVDVDEDEREIYLHDAEILPHNSSNRRNGEAVSDEPEGFQMDDAPDEEDECANKSGKSSLKKEFEFVSCADSEMIMKREPTDAAAYKGTNASDLSKDWDTEDEEDTESAAAVADESIETANVAVDQSNFKVVNVN